MAGAPMPKASIYKGGEPYAQKDEARPDSGNSPVESVPQAQPPDSVSKLDLRRGVATSCAQRVLATVYIGLSRDQRPLRADYLQGALGRQRQDAGYAVGKL